MYHISDLKKFTRCPRFYFLDVDSDNVFNPYLRSDDSFIDLLKDKLGIKECFTGKVGDSTDLFFKNINKHEWFIMPRFELGKLRIKVPVLHKNKDGFDIYFIYYGTSVRDLDFFTYRITVEVLEKLGLLIDNIYLAYVNPEFVNDGVIDPEEVFNVTDHYRNGKIINMILDSFVDYDDIINKIETSSLETSPAVKTRACHLKNVCEYYGSCFKEEKDLPEDTILSLASSKYKNKMYEEGIEQLKDADLEKIEGNRVQYAQIMASKNEGLFVDKVSLSNWLKRLDERPISFIDFEWDRYLIPSYKGMRPLDVIPFEFALYIDNEDGKLEHKTFVSSGDCRKEFIETLIEALPKKGKILAYNAEGAEILRLQELEVQFPEYKEELDDIISRFVDLACPFVEGLVYDTRMMGNYSLKKLVDIISDKSYKDLDIDDGMEAVYRWRDIDKGADVDQDKIIDNLKKYCSLDAYGLYLVYKWLLNIAK